MIKNNKTCTLCGKAYAYCNSCASFNDKPFWMAMYCSEDCKDIVPVLTDYIYNKIEKDKAKDILDAKDTSRHMFYHGSYAKAFNDIYNVENVKDEENEEEQNEESKKRLDISQSLAQQTTSEIKKNITAEAKKTYPKAIAHKHGK